MALDFPAQPSPGDTFDGKWVWDGEAWSLIPAASGGGGGGVPTDVTGVGTTFVLQDHPTVNQPLINQPSVVGVSGPIGQLIQAFIAQTPGVPLPNGVITPICSIDLLQGVWDINATIGIDPQGRSVTGFSAYISTSPTSGGITLGNNGMISFNLTFTLTQVFPIATRRLTLNAPGTIYLVGVVYTTGIGGFGNIEGRRVT